MIMASVRLSPQAVSDLQDIKDYITDKLCNPMAADRIIKQIINDYSLLEISPLMGPSLSSVIRMKTDYRYIVSGKYIIIYKADNEYVSIYRILYGARDYLEILFEN